MKASAGLWIDHARAVVVTVTVNGAAVKSIESHVDKQPRRRGGVVSRIAREPVPPDDKAQRAYRRHLNGYYDKVIASIRGADPVLVFGPGKAKDELATRIRSVRRGRRIVGVETTDKMTQRQIVAKVRRQFMT
jgi:hypothetical protein